MLGIPALEENIGLAPFTTFKIGGPAKYFVRAKTKEDVISAFQQANQQNIPVYILGGGSNILVHDQGFDGLVIKMELMSIDIQDTQLIAGAGTLLSAVIMQAVKAGLTGLEFATGIPASVGGAVWANLGSRGSEIQDVITQVTVVDEAGNENQLSAEECQFSSRESIFKHHSWMILDATFQLQTGEPKELRQNMIELTKQKKAEQNVGEDTAGCAFRNPDDSEFAAAQLIDELGLKGHQIGGAQVSAKHANFILNTGNATADDVVQLISYVKQQVRDKKGVQLMEEVEYVGF